MQRYQHIIGTLSNWIFLCLVAALPYPDSITRPLWVAWLISYLLEGRIFRQPKLTKEHVRSLFPIAGLCLLAIWECASAMWAGNTHETWLLLGRHVNFFAVLLVGVFGTNNQLSTKTIVRTFIGSAVVSVFVYLMLHYWLMNPRIAMWKNWHEEEFPIDWLQMQDLTFHIKHRLYYGSVLCFALMAILLSFKSNCKDAERWQVAVLSGIGSLILLAGIYWCGSRASLLNLAACFCFWALWKTPGKKKIITASALIVSLGLGLLLVIQYHPRFEGQSREEVFAYDEDSDEPATEPRIAIWHAALENPSDYLAYGVGAGNSVDYMVEQYQERGWDLYAERRFSPHNQYFAELIELGIAGFIFFVALWFAIPFSQKGKSRKVAFYIVIILMCDMLTETILGTIEGVFLCCFAILFLFRLNAEQEA